MQANEFFERVRQQANLPTRGDAERACYATLDTLGELMPAGVADNVAVQLPPEIGRHLRRDGGHAAGPGGRLGRADFLPTVAARAGVGEDQAAYIARAVNDALIAATEGGLMTTMADTLPPDPREWVTPGRD